VGALLRAAFGAVFALAIILHAWPQVGYSFVAEGRNLCGGAGIGESIIAPGRSFFDPVNPFMGLQTSDANETRIRITAGSAGLVGSRQAGRLYPWRSWVDDLCAGGVGVDVAYRLMQSSLLHGFTFSGGTAFTDSAESARIDSRLRSTAARLLESEPSLHHLHVNVSWNYNREPGKEFQDNNYSIVVGYDYRIGRDMMLIFDFVHELDPHERKESRIAEAGVSYQFLPLAVFSLGAGASIDDESHGFHSGFNFEYAF
jgi:hypothetical protein